MAQVGRRRSALAGLVVGLAAWAQLGARRAAPSPASRSSPRIRTIPTPSRKVSPSRRASSTKARASTARPRCAASTSPAAGPRSSARWGRATSAKASRFSTACVYQLTWQNGVVVVYDLETFEVERTMQYEGEGWGLTHDGRQLIMSDGSATIRFRDPQTFAVTREIEVRADGVARAEVERARVHRRRDLGEHLVRRPHRAHLAGERRGARLHRLEHAVSAERARAAKPC